MNITELVSQRYATKSFDPNKQLTPQQTQQLRDLLRLSPSSTNLQPWHFIIAETQAGKARIAKGTQGLYQFNEAKVLNASQIIVFCARTDVDETYMQQLLQQEEADGRFSDEGSKQGQYDRRKTFADMHRYDLKDLQHWLEKQVYLNIGSFLLGMAALGLDALPIEGVDLKVLDEEFNLRQQDLTSVLVVCVGHRAEDDFNSPDKTPKSRFPEAKVVTLI